jgi:hypothetical protein
LRAYFRPQPDAILEVVADLGMESGARLFALTRKNLPPDYELRYEKEAKNYIAPPVTG